jgi:hypothetical protein
MTHTSALRRHSGIVTFVGVLFVVVGAYNALSGVVALVKDDWYAVDELLFGDLVAWGIWWIIIGAVQLFASYEILNRREFGFYLGIGLAGVNMFTQLLFIGAYPIWSVTIMALDLVLIFVLCRHVAEFLPAPVAGAGRRARPV